MGKRGFLIISETVLYVLAVVIIVFIAFFSSDYSDTVTSSSEQQTCRESVRQNALAHIRGLTIPTKIECATEDIKINNKDAGYIKARIATAMYDCWWEFGEGRYKLFSQDTTYCHPCALIDFGSDEPVSGFFPYLVENTIPDGSGRSYVDYLMGFQTQKAKNVLGDGASYELISEMQNAETEELNPDETYAVIFVYTKGKDNLRKVLDYISLSSADAKLGAIAGVAAGGTVTGSSLASLAVIGLASGPIGWIALGTGMLVGAAVYGAGYYFSSDNWPEWASYVVLREWDAEQLDGLGCEQAP